MPRIPTGNRSGSPPKPSVYHVSRGEDQDRVNAIQQHSLTSKLSDGSQLDSSRLNVMMAASRTGVKPRTSSFTTGRVFFFNLEDEQKSGGEQYLVFSEDGLGPLMADPWPYPDETARKPNETMNEWWIRLMGTPTEQTTQNMYVEDGRRTTKIKYVPKPWTGRGGPRED